MRLLHRYLFFSILGTVILSVALFVFVLLAGNVIRDVLSLLASGRLSWGMFLELILLIIPYIVAYALPLGMLTGILIVLGRLSSQQEVTAMKAAGLNLYHLSVPIFAIAFLGMILSVFINNYHSPKAKREYRNTLATVIRDNPVNFLETRTFIDAFPGYVIYVGDREGSELHDFWIWELDEAQRARNFIRANKGRFDYDEQDDAIVLTLLGAVGEKRRDEDLEDLSDQTLPLLHFNEWSVRLSLEEILGSIGKRKKLSTLTLDELLEVRKEALAELNAAHTPQAIEAARTRVVEIQLQIQKNLSMAFSVFSLVLIGIPLGIKVGRKESYANLALALALALVFYLLMIVFTWLEKQPALRPDILIWVPNIIFQGAGLVLLSRANRH